MRSTAVLDNNFAKYKMPEEKIKLLKEELQKTKENLVNLEFYMEEFSSFLPLAVCVLDSLKTVININSAFTELSGYSPSDMIKERLEKIFSDRNLIEGLLDTVQKKVGIFSRELILTSKDKKEIPANVFASARKDKEGNFTGYFLAITDITEIKKSGERIEKKAEGRTKELEESRMALMNILEDVETAQKIAEAEQEKTQAIIANLSDGLMVFDKEGKLSLINIQAEKTFGVKNEEVLGKRISELSQTQQLVFLKNLLGGEMKEIFREELSLRENLVLEVSSVPLMMRGGKSGFLFIIHDITREKNIEKMKSEFVSVSAHQLRTPLSAIKWTLRAIIDGDAGNLSNEQMELLQKTYISNERMISLVNDLLDVSRIEEGRDVYKPVLGDLEPLVVNFISSYEGEIKRKQISIEFKKIGKRIPKIVFDAEKLKLVIQNLLENAIRYTPPGGKVTVVLKNDKKEVELSVQDTGIGIPENQQERIFTKFFRGQNVLRMETEGTGLGLFIAKNIIEAHKGRIWFESEENKGTVFHFALPVGEEFEEFLKEF